MAAFATSTHNAGQNAETLIPPRPWSQVRSLGNALRQDYDKIDVAQILVI
jgi:hypothetical protein